MDRRDAIKSLASMAATTGMSLTPITTKDADQCVMVVLKVNGRPSYEVMARVRDYWEKATEATPLATVKTVVLDSDIDVEFVRR